MKIPRLLDGALIAAGLTGAWLFIGFVAARGFDARMGVPEGELPHDSQTLLLNGFVLSLGLVIGAALVLLLRHADREKQGAPENPTMLEAALLVLLATTFFALDAILPFGSPRFRVGNWVLPYTWGDLALVAGFTVTTSLFLAGLRRWEAHRGAEFARSSGGLALVAIVAFALVAEGAHVFGTQQASDELWHVADYSVVTFHGAPGSELENATFFFVAHTPMGYYVRDLADVGGRNATARFIPERLVDGAVFETMHAGRS
jgi:hypothetical protein